MSSMTSDNVRDALRRLNLTQAAAARLLWTEERSVRRWCSGEREISGPAAAMLNLLEHDPAVLAAARHLAETKAA